MNPHVIEMIGQQFGRLLVLERAGSNHQNGNARWKCRCQCGNEKIVDGCVLRRRAVVSCGCFHREELGARAKIHGDIDSPTYSSWKNAKRRCFARRFKAFNDYGGRGITMCDRWRHDYVAFLSDMGPRPTGFTLDRINVNGNYEPSNCRWATRSQQQLNRRKKTDARDN